MTQKMEWKNGDVYINDVLAWRNPDRSGSMRNVNARHVGNELWVNNELVYVHPTAAGRRVEDPVISQPGKTDLFPTWTVLLIIILLFWAFG